MWSPFAHPLWPLVAGLLLRLQNIVALFANFPSQLCARQKYLKHFTNHYYFIAVCNNSRLIFYFKAKNALYAPGGVSITRKSSSCQQTSSKNCLIIDVFFGPLHTTASFRELKRKPIDITASRWSSSKYTGIHPSGPWWTFLPSKFNMYGTLGPHRSMSKSPTWKLITFIYKMGLIMVSLSRNSFIVFPGLRKYRYFKGL